MIRTLVKKYTVMAIACLAFGSAFTAHAKSYVGTWDPAFGLPFSSDGSGLGWSGTTTFSIDDSCGSSGIVNSSVCGMTIDIATVSFYNLSNPSLILETLTFAPPQATPVAMFVPVGGGDPTGVWTNGTLGSVQANSISALTFDTNYFFDLQFIYNGATGNQEVKLFYAQYDSTNPFTCPYAPGDPFCGVSGQGPGGGPVVMTITPVPEPSTYALMLAGLGAVGFAARRRRR